MLIDQLNSEFGSEIRSRGRGYASGGHVTRLTFSPGQIRASVSGTEQYTVSIEVERSGAGWLLRPDCDCAYGVEHDGRCKHVWAVLIKAEQQRFGSLGPPPARVRMGSAFGDDDTDDKWDDESDDQGDEVVALSYRTSAELEAELRRRLAESQRSSAKKEPKPKPEKPPGWVNLMAQAPTWYSRAPSDSKPPPVGELLFVVDAERSHATHALVVAIMSRKAGKKKPKRVMIEARHIAALSEAQDRVICGMLVGAGIPAQKYGYGYENDSGGRSSLWKVEPRMLPVVAPLMKETGRLFWCEDERSELQPLTWDASLVWERVLCLKDDGERGAMLSARVRRVGQSELKLEQELVVIEGDPGAVLCDGVLSPLLVHGDRHMSNWLNSASPRGIKREHVPRLLTELGRIGVRMPLVWPESWRVKEVGDIVPRGRLSLLPKSQNSGWMPADTTVMAVAFEYGSALAEAGDQGEYVGSATPAGEGGEELVLIRRNTGAERALLARLEALGASRNTYGINKDEYKAPTKKVAGIVLALLKDGWEVRGGKTLYRRPGEIKIDVTSGIDWFDVHGSVKFDGGGSAGIAELLEALKRGDKFVTLGDGSLGMLPEEWLEKHGGWLRLGRAEGDEKGAVRFSKAQLGLIDALLAEMPEATCDAQVAAARKRLARFEGVAARREPKSFRGELRPYQREGLGWLRFLAEFEFGGILADDMGLGKTVQLLAHLAELKEEGPKGAWLVVAPKSLVFNWAREAERFAPGLKVIEHTGLERRGRNGIENADLVLTTYGTMRRDVELLGGREWAGVVLDEAQAIKNADSQAAKAARVVGARARRRLALTGTPVENRLSDLWSIMDFLNPGMLGGAAAFREAMGSGAGGDGADLMVLRRAMRPFILRRTKDRVAPELPARSEQTISCELGPAQRELYNGVLAHYRQQLLGTDGVVERQGMGRSRIHVLEALLRLRQAACHAALLESKPNAGPKKNGKRAAKIQPPKKAATEAAQSAKVDTLLEMLEETVAEGHRALIFSQFTSLLALVREQLRAKGIAHEYLDGQTSAKERAAGVDRFQTGSAGARVFLISLKAGGVGLNLTAADYVFLLDPWWNPAVEAQAIDRAHRIGQTKKVIAYRLIARGTVEEKIQELQAGKRELAAAIVGEDGAERDGPLASLTREELGWLLGA